MHKTTLATALTLALSGMPVTQAITTTGNNFSMLQPAPTGDAVGGTNDVVFTWDETLNTDPSTAVVNASITSTSPFFGVLWVAHDIMIYGPGTYTFDSGCPGGDPTCDGSHVLYRGDDNFNGTDSFTYTVVDSDGGAATATVAVTVNPVNDAPDAFDDMLITNQDSGAVSIDPLANDSDIEGDSFTVTGIFTEDLDDNGEPLWQTIGGTVTFSANSVSYTPNPGFSGLDVFGYEVTDGIGGQSTALVRVAVNATGNTAPVTAPESSSKAEDTAHTISILDNDSDADGDALSVLGFGQGAIGDVVLLPAKDSNPDRLRYTPNKDISGADSFSYTVADSRGGSATAIVDITITASNDKPIVSDDMMISAQDAGATTINPLLNDSDPEGDTLTVTEVTTYLENGFTGEVIVDTQGTVTFTADSVTYTPNAGFSGIDEFRYTVSDGDKTKSAFVNIAVNATGNTPPIANDDVLVTDEDSQGKGYVIDNGSDTDTEDAKLRNILATSSAANGTTSAITSKEIVMTVNAGQIGGHMLFDWNGNYDIDLLNVWDSNGVFWNGTEMVHPGNPGSDPGNTTTDPYSGDPMTVWDRVSTDHDADGVPGMGFVDGPFIDYNGNFNLMDLFAGTNIPPIARAGTLSCDQDAVCNGNVTATMTDGDPITYSLNTDAVNGLVTVNGDGSYTYTPTSGYNGPDSFSFDATDVHGTDTAVVSITVLPPNQAPTAPALTSPDNGVSDLDPNNVIVRWDPSTDADGDNITYQVTVCDNAGFTGCAPTDVAMLATPLVFAGIGGASLVFFGLTGVSRRTRYQVGALLIAVSLISACAEDSDDDPAPTPQPAPETCDAGDTCLKLTGLASGTTYYWKVTASDGSDSVDSAMRSFTTK